MSPRTPGRPSSAVLVLAAALIIGLVEIDVLEYSYERMGLRPRAFGLLLAASLLGSLVNVPLGRLRAGAGAREGAHGDGPAETTGGAAAPAGGTTVLAVNLGGAVVPTGLSLYLVMAQALGWPAAAATVAVALVTHALARPMPGVGITLPVFVPPLVAAASALVLEPERAPAVAYVAGTLGTLVGADLSNLHRVRGLGAPVVSIGGAGTFDGIFLAGLLAVLLA